MNRKYSIICSLLITLLILNSLVLFTHSSPELETVVVARIIDGDTLELTDGRTIRLLNINAPEKSNPLSSEASTFLSQYKNSQLHLDNEGQEKYGRTLGRLYDENHTYLNLYLVSKGLSSKFLVSDFELEVFANAEDTAITSQQGIWHHSPYYGCIQIQIDQRNEIVKLTSQCTNVQSTNWIIKDESRKEYILTLTTFDTITLHTSSGEDNITDIFWNSKTDIWNNDRDTMYIFDADKNIIAHKSYGY